MENRKVRLRFAPSPTGPLHIGGVRSALYNYLFAKKHGGDFILRIEDTDQNRYVEGAEAYIVKSLAWCGIHPDEGPGIGGEYTPYRQSERKELGVYQKYADQLVASGNAYYAFDTAEELDAMRKKLEIAKASIQQYSHATRGEMKNSLSLPEEEWKQKIANGEPFVVRLKVPAGEEIRFTDVIRGEVVFNSDVVDDKVLLKSDGMPTYHLAHIVDDVLMDITHAVRGEEWLPSAPSHILIYRYLGWEDKMPQYAHLPLLLKPDGNGKLSKRDGDRLGFSVFPLEWKDPSSGEISSGYRETGYFPEAVVNMLALLGWNMEGEKEIFSMEELIANFSFEHVHKAGAKFNPEKAKWFNEQYLKEKPDAELAELLKPILLKTFNDKEFKDEFVVEVCRMMKDRVTFVSEIATKGSFFFVSPNYTAENLAKISKTITEEAINAILDVIGRDITDAANLEASLKEVATAQNLKIGEFMKFLRISIVGELSGPGVPDLILLLGANEAKSRVGECWKLMN